MTLRHWLGVPVALSLCLPGVARAQQAMNPVLASTLHTEAAPDVSANVAPAEFTLTVVVVGASQEGGRIGAALFNSADDFLDDDRATQRFVRPRTAAVDSFVFTGLEAGEYAIAAFHDANGNGKIDKHWFGAPKESWGTSGDVRPRLRAPRFDEARVQVTGDVRVEIVVKR